MLTRTTRADVAAYALAQAGRSRDRLPVPWTASPVMDDCAAFCSHILWGGKPGPILWVDGFKSAGDGTYAGGSSDLAPWDVLLFDWEGNGVGNHVEFMVGDLGNGYVRTYGANGSDSREARYRTRPKHYILGRFRPTWGTPPTNEGEDEMAQKDVDDIKRALAGLSRQVQGLENRIKDPRHGTTKFAEQARDLAQRIADKIGA